MAQHTASGARKQSAVELGVCEDMPSPPGMQRVAPEVAWMTP
jgi:hypothetical protein